MQQPRSFRRVLTATTSLLMTSGLVLGAALFLSPQAALADAGGVHIHVTRDGDGAGLDGATVAVACDGHSYHTLSTSVSWSGGYLTQSSADFQTDTAGDCVNNSSVYVRVSDVGYVTYAHDQGLVKYKVISDPNEFEDLNIPFQLNVATPKDELNNTIVPDSVTFNGEAPTLTVGTTRYWAITPSTAQLVVSKDGYVDSDVSNTGLASVTTAPNAAIHVTFDGGSALSAAVNPGDSVTAQGLQFANKVTVDDETVANHMITGTTANWSVDGGGSGSCTVVGSTVYCPTVIDAAAPTISIAKNGYVTRILQSELPIRNQPYGVQSITTDIDMEHAVRVTVRDETTAQNLIGGGTVQTGNGHGTTCVEDTTGVYYCAVPIDDDETNVQVAKTGFVTLSLDNAWTDRVVGTDPQQVVATTAFQYGQKIVLSREGDDGAVSGATVTAGSMSTSCVEDAGDLGSYYCQVPSTQDGGAGDIHVTGMTGYVNRTASTHDRATAASPRVEVDLSNIRFGLKLIAADELGNSMNPGFVKYNGGDATYSSGGTYYFAQPVGTHELSIESEGFISGSYTNDSIGAGHGVTTASTAQVTITMGNYDAQNGSTISSDTNIKGLQYKLKSKAFRSMAGIAPLTDISEGNVIVAATPAVGVNVISARVSGNQVYIAISGNGGDDDAFTIQLKNVTADGGARYQANFVNYKVSDFDNVIATGATGGQKTFDIAGVGGSEIGDIDAVDGLLYPLLVTVKDELGSSLTSYTATYDGHAPYLTIGVDAAFANLSVSAPLEITSDGFIPNQNTNTGLNTVRSDTSESMMIHLGATSTADTITPGTIYEIKGMQYAFKSGVLRTEVGGDITGLTPTSMTLGGGGAMALGNVVLNREGGTTLVGAAIDSDNHLYIAATGDGSDGDALIVQLSGVNMDGGTGGDLVRVHLPFPGLTAETSQQIFNVCGSGSGCGGSPDLVTPAFKYPLKVNLADELGNALTYADLSSATFNSHTPFATDGSALYWAEAGAASMSLMKQGFIPNEYTNTAYTSVSPSQVDQTTISLGANSPLDALSPETNNDVKGFEYALKSNTIQTELHEWITDIADSSGYQAGGAGLTPSANVTLAGRNGLTIDGSAVHDNTIYVAAHGNGGGDDTLYLALRDVTAAGRGATDSFNSKLIVDDGNTGRHLLNMVATNEAQATFDIGQDHGASIVATGMTYPLKVRVNDQMGYSIRPADLDTFTFNGSPARTSTPLFAYFGDLTSDKTLVIQKEGYVDAATADSSLTDVSTDVDAGQTYVYLNGSTPRNSPIPAGASATNVQALEYGLAVTVRREGDNHLLTSGSVVTAGAGYGYTCIDSETGTYYCLLPLSDTSTTVRIVRTGGDYLTKYLNYDHRTAVTSPQDALTGVLITPGDITPPSVIDQNPEPGMLVSATTLPSITFSEAMDPSSLNGGTVKLKVFGTNADVPTTLLYDPETFTVVLHPVSGALDYSSHYYLYVNGAKDEAGNRVNPPYLVADQASHDFYTNANPADVTPPTITAQSPDQGSLVEVTAVPAITFSEPMDPATLNGGTIKLKVFGTNTDVPSTLLYDPATYAVSLNPVGGLAYSSHYYLYVSGAKDVAGNTESTSYLVGDQASHDFYTVANPADVTPPSVTAQSPANGTTNVAVTSTPTLTFSEAMDPATLNGGTIKLKAVTDGATVPVVINYNPSSFVVTLTPVSRLANSTSYFLYASGTKDIAGNFQTPYVTTSTQSFTTSNDGADVTPPSVTAQSPTNGTTNVAVTSTPTLTFSEAMDSATLNGGTIKLKAVTDGATVPVVINYNPSSFVVTLTPVSNLAFSTSYFLYALGAKDIAGNTMTSYVTTSTQSFTTAANTADLTPPTASLTTPAASSTNVSTGVSPTLTFSEAVDPATLNGGTIKLKAVSDGSEVSSVLLYNPASHVVTIDPVSNLLPNTYYFVYASGTKDIAGNFMTPYVTTSTQQFLTANDATTLSVTSISPVNTYATAGGGFASGWSWTFYITASSTQTAFSMKLSDFLGTTDSIAAASNIRYYSAQSSDFYDASHARLITAANTYSSPITLSGDLDATAPGRQIAVTVEMQVPVGAAGGNYGGSYGVRTQ